MTDSDQKYPYGYGLSKLTLIKLRLDRANLRNWSFILMATGLGVQVAWAFLETKVFADATPYWASVVELFILSFGWFLWGCVGAFWTYRRQVPRAYYSSQRRISDMITGIFVMIASWGGSLMLFVIGISKLINPS